MSTVGAADETELDEDFHDRRSGRRRHLFRFDPTINSGHLVQIAVILLGMGTAYATYQVDKTRTQLDVAQLKVESADARAVLKENISDIKRDIRDVQKSVNDLNTSLAIINSQKERK